MGVLLGRPQVPRRGQLDDLFPPPGSDFRGVAVALEQVYGAITYYLAHWINSTSTSLHGSRTTM
jgi:hypothetical protein